MKTNLFGKHIEKACEYCEKGKLTADRQMVLCEKYGSRAPYSSCSKFDYSPLKRTPTRIAPLPKYTKEDFSL